MTASAREEAEIRHRAMTDFLYHFSGKGSWRSGALILMRICLAGKRTDAE